MSMLDDWPALTDTYYTQATALAADPELGAPLKRVTAVLHEMQKADESLSVLKRQHAAGHVSDDQLPKLRATILADAERAYTAAEGASHKLVSSLQPTIASRVFRPPDRGAITAEAKGDLERRYSQVPAEELPGAVLDDLDRYRESGDRLAVQLLVSDVGRDLMRARGLDAEQADTGCLSCVSELWPMSPSPICSTTPPVPS
jgi:hypothetical protein